MPGEPNNNMIELTADIVAAYVQKNAVPVSGLPDLIASVNSALSNISPPSPTPEPVPKPAVNPKRSVFPDYIISLEDGRKYKSLKRHLATSHGLTPDEYRTKWGLAKDYPMVAPSYSATRSALAKSLGLGRKPAPAKKPATKRKARA
ncbi:MULTISPECIES: MucR family transcriptional regulator [Mesorhizobium]|uniref:MucR family transcriptional regulator n=1 Tax=Mesorhizobium TaxID=68287 RepID=UPI000BAF29BF|nr:MULTISPECIES: MucR family transcriptional regulator [Mesorhizobium]PBB29703.1 transcriptional regulator [Mesorhizobium sp. WSM3882]PBB40596.1 transcriptional regulator [Mesorhizobium sp. WSM3866]PBB59122.1 transcriptional regulator [Mesorhizobium loti]PBB80157.1 transcriptional regulator [Mesorhizobium sp. WSM3879]PBB85137.1 transcriptional regulator [Mesorhizobium sp. WSM3876]